eukprot:g7829.t1
MACLRFGTDEWGKEILELVGPATATTATAAAAAPSTSTPESSISSRCSSKGASRNETANNKAPETMRTAAAGNKSGPSPGVSEGISAGASGGGVGCVGESSKPYKGENTIVMMEWEKPYMRALVDNLHVTEESDVLEIGFGCGYSADRIQDFSPRSHTIVEPDPVVLARLRGWAATRPGVVVVEGFWQSALATLGRYDAIFFDDFPLPGTPDSSDLRGPVSRWHTFIDLCVSHHLPIGGRITGYLARPLPLSRPGCKASPLTAFPVDVPENCPYFPYGEAYIPLITRVTTGARGSVARKGGAGTEYAEEDAGTALASSLLLRGVERNSAAGPPPPPPGGERKRQKRQVLETMVRESLGLSAIGE